MIFLIILLVAGIDFIFGFDNGFIIASLTKNLPKNKKTKLVIFIGVFFSLVFRTTLAFLIYYLEARWEIPIIEILGGILIFYLVYKATFKSHHSGIKTKNTENKRLFEVLIFILLIDFSLSLDNAFGIVSILELHEYKMWIEFLIIFFGLAITVPIIFFGALRFGEVLKKSKFFFYFSLFILLFLGFNLIIGDYFWWSTIPHWINGGHLDPPMSLLIIISLAITIPVFYLVFLTKEGYFTVYKRMKLKEKKEKEESLKEINKTE